MISVDAHNNGAITSANLLLLLDAQIDKGYASLKVFKVIGKNPEDEIGEKEHKARIAEKEFKHFDAKMFISALEESDKDKNSKNDFNEVLRCISDRFENETHI